MTKDQKKYLDSMSDEQLLAYLNIVHGEDQPIWKRCSKKEYERHCGPVQHKKHEEWNESDIQKLVETLCNISDYKAVPIYKHKVQGLIALMNQIDDEPIGYKYYKKKGTKRVIMIGSEIADYLDKRKIEWRNS